MKDLRGCEMSEKSFRNIGISPANIVISPAKHYDFTRQIFVTIFEGEHLATSVSR
jgi:hypothetical protein